MIRSFFVVAVVATLSDCSDKPARERFPGPPGRTTEFSQALSQQVVMGNADKLAQGQVEDASSAPAGASTDKPASGATLKGTVRLKKGIAPEGKYLFVALRPAAGGPPIAVKREYEAKFPYTFEMSGADVMIPGTPFEGDVTVTVRLKQDPDPLSRRKGDWSTTQTAKIGGKALDLTIDQVEP